MRTDLALQVSSAQLRQHRFSNCLWLTGLAFTAKRIFRSAGDMLIIKLAKKCHLFTSDSQVHYKTLSKVKLFHDCDTGLLKVHTCKVLHLYYTFIALVRHFYCACIALLLQRHENHRSPLPTIVILVFSYRVCPFSALFFILLNWSHHTRSWLLSWNQWSSFRATSSAGKMTSAERCT